MDHPRVEEIDDALADPEKRFTQRHGPPPTRLLPASPRERRSRPCVVEQAEPVDLGEQLSDPSGVQQPSPPYGALQQRP